MSNTVEIIINELRDVKDEDLVENIANNVLPKIQNNFLMRTLMGTIKERNVLNDFIRDFILQELQELSTWNRSKHKQMEDNISHDIILEPVIINRIDSKHEIPNLTEEGVYDRRTIEDILKKNDDVEIQYHELEFEKSRLVEYVKDFYKKSEEKIHLFFVFCEFVGFEINHSKPLVPKIRELFSLSNKLSTVLPKPEEIIRVERTFFTKFGNSKEKFGIMKISFNKLLETEGKSDEEIWDFYTEKIHPFFQEKKKKKKNGDEEVEGEGEEGEEGKNEEEEEEEEDCKIDPSEDPLSQLIEMGNRKALDFHLESLFKEKGDEIGEQELEGLFSLSGKQNEKYVIMKCLERFPKNENLKGRVLKISMEEGDDDLFIRYCGEDKETALRLLFKTMFSLSTRVKELEGKLRGK